MDSKSGVAVGVPTETRVHHSLRRKYYTGTSWIDVGQWSNSAAGDSTDGKSGPSRKYLVACAKRRVAVEMIGDLYKYYSSRRVGGGRTRVTRAVSGSVSLRGVEGGGNIIKKLVSG